MIKKREWLSLKERETIGFLENLVSSYLNGKITKEEFARRYSNYCNLRDM